MVASQIKCSRFEQRSVIKFLMAEKCQPHEIYSEMWYLYEGVCFSKKIFTNMGLA